MLYIPNGFYITAYEQRCLGINVNDTISDNAKFVPPSYEEFKTRVAKGYNWREIHEIDGKYAELNGDGILAELCRSIVNEVDEVISIWKARWAECCGVAS